MDKESHFKFNKKASTDRRLIHLSFKKWTPPPPSRSLQLNELKFTTFAF